MVTRVDAARVPLLLLLGATLSVSGQIPASATSTSAAANPMFQVATIKPSDGEETRTLQIRGNRFATTGTSVIDLLKYAYGFDEQEIVGGPDWIKTRKFDLVGDPETKTRPSSEDFKKMVQDLLADRFHLATHRETRSLSVFEIVLAKRGPKLLKSSRPPNGIPTVGYSSGELSVANATMVDFAAFLQRFVTDRPVLDQTGITGRYDLTLQWSPDELESENNRGSGDRGASLPGLFTAIQEQLGLKLQVAKLPTPVVVIDHLELPSEN